MFKPALIVAILLTVAAASARAQDIVGLEDCSKATSADKKLGCLQSNVQFLHGLIRKNDAAAQAKLREAAAQLAAAHARTEQLAGEIARLKSALDRLEKKAPAK